MEGLSTITSGIDDDLLIAVTSAECSCELSRQHNLISVTTLLHPLPDPLLRLLFLSSSQQLDNFEGCNASHLIVISGIDEVASTLHEVVKDCFGVLLVALAHKVNPK